MSVMLRSVLILVSILTLLVMMQKIRQAKVQIEDSLFWLGFTIMLIVFSIAPQLVYWISDRIGTMAPSNFVFLFIIFLILVRLFKMTIRVSQLESSLKELIQKQALDEAECKKTDSLPGGSR
ncbi:MAG: DUF2304 domain-containing protein [Hungatella sp.]